MVERIRLSEISSQATAALTVFDAASLDRLAARLDEVVCGRLDVEPETAEAITMSQQVFQGVLHATGQSIQVLQRLHERKVEAEWAR